METKGSVIQFTLNVLPVKWANISYINTQNFKAEQKILENWYNIDKIT